MSDPNKTVLLTSLKSELMKTKYFFDEEGRNTYIVQAPAHTIDGGAALVTKFDYDGDDVQASGSVEYQGTWDEAWDITETEPE